MTATWVSKANVQPTGFPERIVRRWRDRREQLAAGDCEYTIPLRGNRGHVYVDGSGWGDSEHHGDVASHCGRSCASGGRCGSSAPVTLRGAFGMAAAGATIGIHSPIAVVQCTPSAKGDAGVVSAIRAALLHGRG